ncbi:MAG: hypothetical protein IT561_17385 [Alphaproteobacteria bacterium]|nr:hypothetical protein [Alphaproteobacteria bacterium]
MRPGAVPGLALLVLATLAPLLPGCEEGQSPSGLIKVSGTQVYTRERLINQRLDDEKWLRAQLNSLEAATNLVLSTRTVAQRLEGRLQARTPQAAAGGAPATAPPGAPAAAAPVAEPSLDFETNFLVKSALREIMQHKLLENQLDDRHDLYGNSLYVLKFDVSVVPPERRAPLAFVQMWMAAPKMFSEEKDEKAKSYPRDVPTAELYRRYAEDPRLFTTWSNSLDKWRDDLEVRVNESIARQHASLLEDLWPEAEFVELAQFVRRRLTREEKNRLTREQAAALDLKLTPSYVLSKNGYWMTEQFYQYLMVKSLTEILGIREIDIFFDTQKARTLDISSNAFLVDPIGDILSASYQSHVDANVPPLVKFTNRIDTVAVASDDCRPKDDNPSVMHVPWASFEAARLNVYARVPISLRGIISTKITPQFPFSEEMLGIARQRDLLVDGIPGDFIYTSADKTLSCASQMLTLRTGLFNFIRKIGAADSYSYAVLPRQSVRAALEQSSSGRDVGLQLDATVAGLGLRQAAEEISRGARRRAVVTSFGEAHVDRETGTTTPAFGWLVDAGVFEAPTGGNHREPVQLSVMAVVSVPAWWDYVTITARTGWISDLDRLAGGDRTPPPARPPARGAAGPAPVTGELTEEWRVPLPSAYEGIDAVLLGAKRRKPTIVDREFRDKRVAACKPAAINIPGYRLWRGSRVFLGSQEASEISVLPNMGGLRATFDTVRIPPGFDAKTHGTSIPVSLRVWTNEGVAELRHKITIAIETSC